MDILSNFKSTLCVLLICLSTGTNFAQTPAPYLINETHTFASAFRAYKNMAEKYPTKCQFQQFGSSDYGIPIPLFIMNESGLFTAAEIESKNVVIFKTLVCCIL